MIYPEIDFKPKLQVINTDQITQIHFATLELLERTGVQITNQKALEVLDGAGARIGNRFPKPYQEGVESAYPAMEGFQ